MAERHPVVEAARDLRPLILENLEAGEERARLMPDVVKAAGQAGLFRIYAPRDVGGLEASATDVLAAEEAVAYADPAVSWYIANSLAASHVAAFLGEAEREELFASPDRHFGFSGAPGARAVPCDGGYRVSGSWPVVTGGLDAEWCVLGGLVMDGDAPREIHGQPDHRLFLVRAEHLDISPTWQAAAAMRGTASNAARLPEVFVPEGMAHSPSAPLVIDRPAYRISLWLVFLATNTGSVLGVLRSALDCAQGELSTKISSYHGTPVRDEVPIQELFAKASASHHAIRAGTYALVDALVAAGASKEGVSDALKADVYAFYYWSLDTARETISQLYARGTRAGFIRGNPVERALRNLHAISFGSEAGRIFQHDAGRVLLGAAPEVPAF